MLQIHVVRGVCQDYYDIAYGEIIEIYYNITWGGLPDLLQYYNGGGVSQDPKFVLRNIWRAPYCIVRAYLTLMAYCF